MTKKNLNGKKFGKLTVTNENEKRTGGYYWKCICDCGKDKWVHRASLTGNNTRSCGCLKRSDLSGKRFGKLVASSEYKVVGSGKSARCKWLCNCDCGAEKYISGASLVTGHTKSCGCLIRERTIGHGEAALNSLFDSYKRDAFRRCYLFALTKGQFKTLISSNCTYCGEEPKQQHGKHKTYNGYIVYNGIDRVVNHLGYTRDNCVACCKTCNKLKLDSDAELFLSKINKISEFQRKMQSGLVLLLTGLSGSGKTTLGCSILEALGAAGKFTKRLDGDVGRKTFSKNLGFSPEDRLENHTRAASIASLAEQDGFIVVSSYIAPTQVEKDIFRKLCSNIVVIQIECPIEECARRDPKGMYKKLKGGLLFGNPFTGMHDDAPYIKDISPDMTLNTLELSLEVCTQKVIQYLREEKYV